MSHASSSRICNYDVFLSFRGVDTRINIVSHLYNALQQRGIRTFKDDERLETGKPISDELLKVIEEARFAVVIFSKSYASSRWCLEELAHMIKCKKIVIPVFYDVSPSDVRHQNPPFADSFSEHEVKYKDDMEKVQRWRGAFVEAGKLSGYHLPNFKDEADCIKKLVDDYIFPKLLQIVSPFPKRLVGMKSQVEKVTSLLDMESNDVRSIGICGMGGIGKTEIANFLHQRYRHQFEADCFLGDVGNFHQENGLICLQQQVICKLLGEKMTLTSKHEGMDILEDRLRFKKVLFTLDDVTHREQLEFLAGGIGWFGKGSRIILTARDKHLLISHVGENVYEVQLLSADEALELFSRNAFREKSPKEDFMELSRQVVEHAGRLPLALKVLGSLFYRRDKKEWRDQINRLKRIPPKDILGKLRLSFDGLENDEKELFLDIVFLDIARLDTEDLSVSCFYFLCEELRGVSHRYLVEKALLTNKGNRIQMHNMIREMGKNVILEEYRNSRVWLHKELFEGKLIPEEVESLHIRENSYSKDAAVKYSNIFKRMQRLQILIVDGGIGAITHLPSSLRLIDWWGFPSISFPESFEPSQLLVLRLAVSSLELWPISKKQKLNSLKHLDLSRSFELTETPNFGDMPKLEGLNLDMCLSLEEVHPSLGHCSMLTHLNLDGCRSLKELPKFVCMESLETLNLRGCRSLKEFPEICGDMHRLSELRVESPWIRILPPSLSGLRVLQLTDCEVLESIPDTLRNLRDLRISRSNKLATLPNSLFESQQLEYLEIDRCENLKKLPSSIQMESLKKLKIYNCPKLDTFPEFKGDMHCLNELALISTGIREVPSSIGNLSGLENLFLLGCEDLVSLPDSLCNLMNLRSLCLNWCKKLEKLPEDIGDLQELRNLNAKNTAISQRPSSITKLGKLESLNFSHDKQQFQHSSSCDWHQLSGLSSLKLLDLSNCNILGGLPEDLGSLHFLGQLYVRGSNISCLPKSINKLSKLIFLDIQSCQNLDELPGELPPNLEELSADYHLALKSIRNLVVDCLGPRWLFISDNGAFSREQANNEFLQSFRRTCIQCDFNQRVYFVISFPGDTIPKIFDYARFTNKREISIDLNPSWYTDKFMGFWISYGPDKLLSELEATLVCKSDPERIYSLKHYHIQAYWEFEDPHICCAYIPFATLWDASWNKEGKNPNDYHKLELSHRYFSTKKGVCWGIRLEYEEEATSDIGHPKKKEEALMSDANVTSHISNVFLSLS